MVKLRVFENVVLRRIFGPRRDELTGEWRRLRNEELNDLYCSPINDVYSSHNKVLCYKSEGRWFDSRWCHRNFPLT